MTAGPVGRPMMGHFGGVVPVVVVVPAPALPVMPGVVVVAPVPVVVDMPDEPVVASVPTVPPMLVEPIGSVIVVEPGIPLLVDGLVLGDVVVEPLRPRLPDWVVVPVVGFAVVVDCIVEPAVPVTVPVV